MSIKDLLVHVDHSPEAKTRVDLALALAEHFGARVTAIYLIAEPFLRGVSGHAPADVIQEHVALAGEEADRVLSAIKTEAEGRSIPFRIVKESGSLDRISFLLARDARNSDLVIVGQPNPQTGSRDQALFVEAAFMETGRPALVVPHAFAARGPLRRVLIGWNASAEASRAVHDALPLLKAADDVVILVVDPEAVGATVGRQPGSGVSGHLEQHGVKVRIKPVESDRRSVGEIILAQAAEEAADLLVMGGYGHSRLREAFFGGATRTLLAKTPLPTLISH